MANSLGPSSAMEEAHSARPRRALWARTLPALCLLALFAGVVGFAVRLDYGPDEPWHLEYIHVLATEGRLPASADTTMVQHPPPYYAVMAVAWRLAGAPQRPLAVAPGPDALAAMTPASREARHLLRLLNTLLACVTLLVLARLLTALGVPPVWQTLLLVLVALWPMVQYVSGVVNNENAAILYSAIVCLALVTRVKTDACTVRQAMGIGLLLGAGVWVKQTTLFVVPVALWAVWACGDRSQRWTRLGVTLIAAVAVGLWWPLHNHLLTGIWFPHYTPLVAQEQTAAHRRALTQPLVVVNWARMILETSFLPDWSWEFIPRVFSTAMTALPVAAVITGFVFGLRVSDDAPSRRLRAMALAALLILLASILEHTADQDWRVQIGGRYMLNGLPWCLTLLGSALVLRLRRRPEPQPARIESARPPALLWAAPALLAAMDAAWWSLVWIYYTNPVHGAH